MVSENKKKIEREERRAERKSGVEKKMEVLCNRAGIKS